MTDKRTTIVLGVIAGALLAFILLVERGSLSTAELEARRDHVLRSFVRDRVTRVELVRGSEPPIVLEREEREEDDEEDLGLARWRLALPVASDADQDAADSFLGALEWLTATRTLRGIDAEDRARFGLDEPRFVVRFRAGDRDVELRVGGEAPEGQGVYVAVEGEDAAHVVGRDFVESIDHDAAHFRDKDLFPDDFYASDARRIRVEGTARPIVFEKEGRRWHVRAPLRGWASAGAVDALVRMARDLRAERFVAEEPGDLSRYGLDAPWREMVMERPSDAQGTRRGRLRVGAVCGERTEERYAVAGDGGPVVCVLASALDALGLEDTEALREGRLITTSADAVQRVVLERGGARVEVAREGESGWQVTSGGEARAADDAAISDWLRALRDVRAQAFEAIEGDAPGHGLGAPAVTLTLTRSDADDETEILRLGEASADGAWLRRGDEPLVVRADAAVAELLRADALRFRARSVVSGEAADARSVTLRRGAAEERAVRDEEGAWQLEAPIEAEADRVVVREVVRQIVELRAERFVAARPSAEHGLAAPRLVATLGFAAQDGEEARSVALKIGAATEAGAYAQLEGDDAVFEITRAALEGIDRALVSLDLLTVEASEIQALRIERQGDVVAELRRAGSGWQTAEGAPADADRTQQLVDRLGTLRATGVARYGAPDGSLGLDPPATRVTITRASGAVSIDVGEDQGEGDAAHAPVRRTDVAVVYRVRPDLASIFRTYVP